MANHKSAAKRARQSLKKQAVNSQTKKTIRTLEKKLRTEMTATNKKSVASTLNTLTSKLDKAGKKGVLHWKNVSRKIGRLAAAAHKSLSQTNSNN